MKPIKIFVAITGFVMVVIASAAFTNKDEAIASKEEVKTPGKGFAVVELFTSEGCSSCPPADELVARVQKEDKDKQVYILAFHVDYWNRLGWKDVFSSAEYSKRQHEYAGWLRLKSVYTPQIVVNGQKEFIGSEEGNLRNAITAGLRATPAATLTLNAQNGQGKITVQYHTAGTQNKTLLWALVQKAAQSKIGAGENGGKTLSHVQIVRVLQSQPLNTTETGTAVINAPGGFNTNGWEVIGFVQNKANGQILAAAKSDINTTVNAGK